MGTEFLISRTDQSHVTCNGAQNLKYEGGKKHLRIPLHMQWGTKITVDQPKKTLKIPFYIQWGTKIL